MCQPFRSLILLYLLCYWFQAKEFVKDPSKFAAAAVVAPVADAAPAKKEEEKKVEEDDESGDDDMGFGLFD